MPAQLLSCNIAIRRGSEKTASCQWAVSALLSELMEKKLGAPVWYAQSDLQQPALSLISTMHLRFMSSYSVF